VTIPALIVAAVVAGVVHWLLAGVVFEPLDSSPGPSNPAPAALIESPS
jgi:hypothetical protein